VTNWRAALNFTLIDLAENQSYCLYKLLSWHEIVNRPLATSCEILVASAKFLVALATRKAQFRTTPTSLSPEKKR